MNYQAAVGYLDRHINHEAIAGRIDGLSLDPIQGLLEAMGSPQHACPVIHITGTNGKGSVGIMTSALLEAHGLTVGLYASPHLDIVNERIARDRQPVSNEEFAAAVSEVATAAEVTGIVPSYFEILTAAAFGFFAIEAVDVAVIEVGLLGTYDATNVVRSDVAIITNVGRDHTDGVGNWRSRVAEEKAGIIDPGSRVILGEDDPELYEVFASRSDDDVRLVGRDHRLVEDRAAVGGRSIDIETSGGQYDEVFLPVLGSHQALNFTTAVAATEAFFDRPLDTEVVREAAATI
jgi:dihydrofolate synthase/folylpolyglutamate synthase